MRRQQSAPRDELREFLAREEFGLLALISALMAAHPRDVFHGRINSEKDAPVAFFAIVSIAPFAVDVTER